MNEAHKQYSPLDTILTYIFHVGPPGKHLYLSKVPKHDYMAAGEAGRYVVGFLGLLWMLSWKSQIKDVVKYCS